ncbi:MAG: PEGA domain-containing protein, partial [Bacteroidota bacterium]
MRKIGFLVMLTLIAGSLRAQLREFRVSPFPDAPSSTIVQANTSFPDNAIIFVYTSLPDLNFRSSMNGVNQVTWNPVANRYQILVNPIRQILFVFGKDFIESSMGVISPQSKEVLSFRVEEKLAFRNEEKGTLSITSSPSGAMVTINGIETAYRTPLTREFNSGDLTISLGLPGYLPTDTIIRLTAGGRSAIFLRMRPSWAELSLEVQPAEAVVMVNGQRRWPAAGTGRIEWSGPEDGLRPGTYEIVASLDKHRSVNRMITLSAGDRRNLSLTLEPITGSLSIGSD